MQQSMNIYQLPESSLSSVGTESNFSYFESCSNILHKDSLFLLVKPLHQSLNEESMLLEALTGSPEGLR